MKKIVVSILSMLLGMTAGAGAVFKVTEDKMNRIKRTSDKYQDLFFMMNQWVKIKQSGKSLASYLVNCGYKSIAVYGLGYAGETLLNELDDSEVAVRYVIDQKAESIDLDIKVISPKEVLEKVDAIIVTPITFFGEIEEELSAKIDCPVLSLMNILYEI